MTSRWLPVILKHMGSVNQLTQIRQAFQIPDSVTILIGEKLHIGASKLGNATEKFSVPAGVAKDHPLYTSALNTPVYTNIEFLSGRYETNTPGVFNDFPSLKYDAVLITVTQAKKIVTTDIQGRDGTVKEYIGKDDYTIQVNGIITGANGQHPIDQIADLKKMLDAPIPIDVCSTYLQNLGIVSAVVFDYELAQEAGGMSYQTFSITLKSDIPQELRLTNV